MSACLHLRLEHCLLPHHFQLSLLKSLKMAGCRGGGDRLTLSLCFCLSLCLCSFSSLSHGFTIHMLALCLFSFSLISPSTLSLPLFFFLPLLSPVPPRAISQHNRENVSSEALAKCQN